MTGKLILPAPVESTQPAYPPTIAAWPGQPHSSLPPDPTQYAYPQHTPVPLDPAHYAYPQNAPQPPRKRRRKDPVYLVLSLAIALVVVATLVFVAFGATTLLSNNGTASGQHPTASGIVTNHPNASTPATSQPTAVPTPQLQPSPTPMDQGQGALNVQIVQIPSVVSNDSRVAVEVQTSSPGVRVRLQVSYNATPSTYFSGVHTTNDNGHATLPWNVRIFSAQTDTVQAQVQAVAIDQHGQQVSSQVVTVTVEG